jgi:hypothetical protein
MRKVTIEMALLVDDRPGHVGAHARGHARIDHTAYRDIARQLLVGQDVIDAGGDRLDQLEPRHPGEQAWRRIPADRHLDLFQGAETVSNPHVGAGILPLECGDQEAHVERVAQQGYAGWRSVFVVSCDLSIRTGGFGVL